MPESMRSTASGRRNQKPPKARGPKAQLRAGSTTTENMVVAGNLRRLRQSRDMTQVQLCDFAVVSRSFYQDIEACKANVSLATLAQLRRALKCRWEDIFKGLDG